MQPRITFETCRSLTQMTRQLLEAGCGCRVLNPRGASRMSSCLVGMFSLDYHPLTKVGARAADAPSGPWSSLLDEPGAEENGPTFKREDVARENLCMEKKFLWALLAFGVLSGPAIAGTYEWTSGWGMGVAEYSVDDGNNNSLNIACPSSQDETLPSSGYVSAIATIEGKKYDSDTQSGGAGFDVIVDGERWTNPFYTDCRVCGANFPDFWKALRQANNLYVSADGTRSKIPTSGLASVIPPLDSPENSCHSAW